MVFTLKKQNHFAHMKERNSTLRDYATQSQHSSSRSRRSSAFHNAPPNPNENTNWIRCLTVCGYIFFVSSPAVFLSYHYTKVWNPKYINKLAHSTQKSKSGNSFLKATTVRPKRDLEPPYANDSAHSASYSSNGVEENWAKTANFSVDDVYGNIGYVYSTDDAKANETFTNTVVLDSSSIVVNDSSPTDIHTTQTSTNQTIDSG